MLCSIFAIASIHHVEDKAALFARLHALLGDVPKQILAKVKQGLPFSEAFAQSTFMTLTHAEENFWSRQTLWNRWIPVATSSGMVWLTITLLAFWAYTKQRRRSAAIKKQWQEDDWDV